MSPEIHRPDPPYLQVVKHIRAEIESERLKDGDRLDSVRTISKRWGISVATATKAIGALKAEGLVRSEPGIGTVVSLGNLVVGVRGRVVQGLEDRGDTAERIEIRAVELIEAPDEITEALNVPKGSQAIRRRWITFRDDTPSFVGTSWFRGGLVEASPLLLVAERLPQGTPKYIEESSFLTAVSGRDQVRVDIAGDEDSEALRIPLGSPVLRKLNWLYDTSGGVIEFSQSVSIVRRWSTYNYEILR